MSLFEQSLNPGLTFSSRNVSGFLLDELLGEETRTGGQTHQPPSSARRRLACFFREARMMRSDRGAAVWLAGGLS